MNKHRLLRLKQAEWRWQDRERGHTVYRHTMPAYTRPGRKTKQPNMNHELLAAAGLAGLFLAIWLMLLL